MDYSTHAPLGNAEIPRVAGHLITWRAQMRTLLPACPYCGRGHLHGDPGARRQWQLVSPCGNSRQYIVQIVGDWR
jgi:hypothetical protein